MEQLDKDLPDVKGLREAGIKNEVLNIEKIVLKLGKDYAQIMHRSMNSFKVHVSKASHNVLLDLLFPLAH